MSYMPQIKSDVHITPDIIFEIIEKHWGYNKDKMFDPCPIDHKFNGLTIKWKDLNFVNPPYSRQKGDKKSLLSMFVDKAIKEKGTTVMLCPSKTDQEWFHKIKHLEIIWIEKRLRFKNNINHATQPHFLVRIVVK